MSPSFNNLLLGTDLVYVPRLEQAYRRYGERFFRKILTPAELDYCRHQGVLQLSRAAGKIAVKEAASKVLGVGLNGLGWNRGVAWRDIETIAQRQSPPDLRLAGRALEVSDRLGIHQWRISLSHDGDYALATAIGLV